MKKRLQVPVSVKRRFKFIEGNEIEFVIAGLALAYVIFVILAFSIYSNIVEKFQLEMKFESEKSFNSVYMTLVDNPSQAEIEMKTEGMSAIGIYSSNGRLYMGLGDAPAVFQPTAKPAKNRLNQNDSTLGVYYFNRETKEIEYFRLSRFNVAFETGISLGTKMADVPEIVYVKFDGSEYYSNITKSGLVLIFALVIITAIFSLVLYIYMTNRKYRIALAKTENLAQLGAAARTLTHEIKNPLSALTIQAALMKKTLPSEYSSDMQVIDHEILRLKNLTDRVSEFLKNPLGTPEKIEVVSFIKEIAGLFPMKIAVESSVSSANIMFDPDRARSVFENLLKNAIESTETKDPQVSVEIHEKKKQVYVSILDRGDGIPEDMKDKLFDPFFTTKIHGSGIGLSITRKFIQAGEGTLLIQDRDGGGTEVQIILPCYGVKENEDSDSR